MQQIRTQFPILNKEVNGNPLIYFDNAATTQKPQSVIDAVSHYYADQNANVHRAAHTLANESTAAFEDVREKARDFINASENNEIIFTSGTTDSINLVAQTFGETFIDTGDEILISEMEHHSNIVPWQMVAEKRGATVKVIPVTNEGELDLEGYKNLISEKTKIVAVTHISNTLGTINPVNDIIAIAHEQNIPVLLDGAQAAAHIPINVQDIDCDFYAFSAHKMYGPTGIGVLYGKREWLEKLPPYRGGGEMIASVSFEKTIYNEIPYKFEAGTPDIAGVIGLGAALDFITSLDPKTTKDYEQELCAYASAQLSTIEGLQIIGTSDRKIGIISFVIEGIHPSDIGTLLDQQGIAVRTGVHCTEPLMQRFQIPGTVRVSLAIYNTKEEIDQLIGAIHKAVTMLTNA